MSERTITENICDRCGDVEEGDSLPNGWTYIDATDEDLCGFCTRALFSPQTPPHTEGE